MTEPSVLYEVRDGVATLTLNRASFHVGPRGLIEEIVRAQQDCMGSWEIEAANQAWDDPKTDARFYPGTR